MSIIYREVRTKINLRNYDNETMSYQEPRKYTFDRTQSVDDETFNITTINTVYMVSMMFSIIKIIKRIGLPLLFRH